MAIPGLAAATDDQAYRATDLLTEADTDARAWEAVFFAVANLLDLEIDLLLFDTTSTYFERDTAAQDGDPPPARGPRPEPAKRRGSAGTGTPGTPALICRRSSSAWP